MRGMNTDGTVVVGDAPLQAPPLVSHTWSAVAMHDKFWAPVERKVRSGGLVLVNHATFETPVDEDRYRVVRFGATDIAANEVAIRAGFDAVDHLAFPAWEQEAART